MTIQKNSARRRGRVKILKGYAMLPQLADSVVHDDAIAVALMCDDGQGHIIDRPGKWADQHCFLGVLAWNITNIAVELYAGAVCAVVV